MREEEGPVAEGLQSELKEGSPEGVKAPAEPETPEGLRQALAQEREKSERYLANWQRAQADFINYRRRTEQERGELVKFSNAMFIQGLLPVLDDLERALDSVSTKLAGLTWVDGLRLIQRKLQAFLEAQGLTQIQCLGEPFDPNFHEAVLFVEGEEGKVVEEIQKGYKLHERVIRPAMVKVGKGHPGEEKKEGEA